MIDVFSTATVQNIPNLQNIATAQYRQAPAGRQQNQGGQGAQANSIRNSARPITGQQQAAGIQVCIRINLHFILFILLFMTVNV